MRFFLSFFLFFAMTFYVHALKMGSFYDPSSSKTTFRVYASDAQKVILRVLSKNQDRTIGEYEMKKSHATAQDVLDKAVLKNTWEISLSGNFEGRWYAYLPYGGNNLGYEILDENRIVVNANADVDVYLFHKTQGWLFDTTAPGYVGRTDEGKWIDEAPKSLVTSGREYFLKDGKISEWQIEVVYKGEFPFRLNGFATADPYCHRLDENSNFCQVTGENDFFTFPASGERKGFTRGHVIHEVHVKDLSFLIDEVPQKIRGTYLGIAHPATLKRLKDLNVTTVEFLPIHQFDPNAAPPGKKNYWGYMTRSFFAVHDLYASTPKRGLEEFGKAVSALHQAGISVIMDVVYNHTSEGDHRGPVVAFKNLAKNEYFRMWDAKKGYFLNTAGCGNVTGTENPVTRKLILDSLKFWVERFHIDGFRFDLGAAIDKETFYQIRKSLPEDTILCAEPWVAEGNPSWYRGDLNEIGIGKWSDKYRQALKGGNGAAGFINGQENEDEMRVLVRGEHRDFGGSGSWYDTTYGNITPAGVINEVEVHDGYTLSDWLDKYGIDDTEKQKRIRLAHTLLMTSVNTPILHLGQEFARTKKGDSNSYDKDSEINWIDWGMMDGQYRELATFSAGLKKVRSFYNAFHIQQRIRDDRLVFLDDRNHNNSAFGYRLRGSDHEIIVLVNSSPYGADFDLPEGIWKVISNGEKVSDRGLGVVENRHYLVHGRGSAILIKKQM